MVMSSTQISALVGQQNQMFQGQMQHAAMLSQHVGAEQTQGEDLMGRAMNVGMGVGAPVAAGAMALAGADPVSLIGRGVIGTAMGGSAVAGAGLVAGGAAVGVGLMAAQYTAKQMMIGAQQQQQLNASLRQNYGFMGAHGRGFTSSGMQGIGEMIRQESMQRGTGGQFAGFEELGTLASRMGQMGLGGQTTRNAFEFNEKFKTMLGQVKEIAEAFNTSLEQAQQVMSSMRGAGIFRNQGAVAQEIRNIAMGGGLATSEVTGMMTVGAQMSRMIGGRGSSGAVGGMRTIENIGMAQQMGLLSDERLYDLTGMSGAEGRRALATQRMQQSARFLRGGLGRRMIAAMAGADGTLDEESADEWAAGGVGTGRTMGMAHRNLGRVGRANFIRNEGRLRGEVLGRFGGLAGVAAMSGWLEQRGMDPMSDRGQIFMSRRLGMSVEEVEQQIKELRNQELMRARKGDIAEDASYRGELEQFKKSRGIEGVKRKLEDARNTVQGKLRQFGADFYSSGSEMLERWINKITGDYVMTVDRDIGQAIRTASSGMGSRSQEVWERRFGGGQGLIGQTAGKAVLERMGGRGGMTDIGAFRAAGDVDRYREAGWGNAIGYGGDEMLRRQLGAIQDTRSASIEGGADAMFGNFGEQNRERLRNMAAMGKLKGGGYQFLENFGNVAFGEGNAFLKEQYQNASPAERARMARDMTQRAGIGGLLSNAMKEPGRRSITGYGGWATVGERQEAFGSLLQYSGMDAEQVAARDKKYNVGELLGLAITKGQGGETSQLLREKAEALGMSEGMTTGEMAEIGTKGLFGAAIGFVGGVTGLGSLFGFGASDARAGGVGVPGEDMAAEYMKGKVGEMYGGLSPEVMKQAAAYAETAAGREKLYDALSREPGKRKMMIREAQERNTRLLAGAEGNDPKKLNALEAGEFEFNKAAIVAAKASALIQENGGDPLSDEQIQQLATEMGTNKDDIKGKIDFARGEVARSQEDNRREYARRRGKAGTEFLKGFREKGMFKGGKLTAEALEKFDIGQVTEAGPLPEGVKGETAGQLFMRGMTEAARLEEQAQYAEPEERKRMLAEALMKRGEAQESGLGSMSPEEMQKLAAAGPRGMRGYLKNVATLEQKSRRWGKHGDMARVGQQFGAMLGIDLSEKEQRGLRGKGLEEVAEALADKGGLTDDTQKDLLEALKTAKTGKGAGVKLAALQGDVMEQQRERRYESAKENDPTVRAITELKTELTTVFESSLSKPLSVDVRSLPPDAYVGGAEGGGGGGGGGSPSRKLERK